MKFCDYARIRLESGAGGPGAISFRREKNIPFGGPDGGHGGNGGHVILRACRDKVTLIDFKYRPHYKAPNGNGGAGRQKAGEAGEDLILRVPMGTEIWVDQQKMADLIADGEEIMVLKGGRGGRGNSSFVTSTNRAPRENTPGEPGQNIVLELRLKILADAGFIGLPNAGKSTLLSCLTEAHPKIGAYPFTTLMPQLGTLITENYQELVLADLPGLVEGAHEGKGLGHRFLAHGERCPVLMHIIDMNQDDIHQIYTSVRQELLAYNEKFEEKPEVIVLTKYDEWREHHPEEPEPIQGEHKLFPGKTVFIVSAHTGYGLSTLKHYLGHHIPGKKKGIAF